MDSGIHSYVGKWVVGCLIMFYVFLFYPLCMIFLKKGSCFVTSSTSMITSPTHPLINPFLISPYSEISLFSFTNPLNIQSNPPKKKKNRNRPSSHVRQRPHRPRRRTALLPRLLRLQPPLHPDRRPSRQGHRRRVRPSQMRTHRGRDGGDAGDV